MLNISKTVDGGKAVIALEGRLDTVTSPELEAAVKETLPGLTELIFDFEKLEYISSAGLRVLLTSQKAMKAQGEMKLRRVSAPIMENFAVTGFSEILTIE